MANKIIATRLFSQVVKRFVKKFKTLDEDVLELRERLMENPTLGTSLGGGLFKIRLGTKSKGGSKSGGFRVITDLVQETEEGTDVYLVTMYDKSEEDSIDKSDLLALVKRHITG